MRSNQLSVSAHLQELIARILKDREVIETKSLCLEEATKPGDNWFGQILEVNIVGRKVENLVEELNIIAKLAPSIETYREFFPIRSIFLREIYIYDVVLPDFIKFQKNLKVKHIFNPFAHCYGTSSQERHEIVLMENMNRCGYRSVSRQHPLDYEHASLVMKSCAKLHAMSFALKNQNSDLFEELSGNIKKSTGVPESLFPLVIHLATNILNGLEKNSQSYKSLENFLKHPLALMKEVYQPESAGEYGVITHGDYQNRNFLFKYEDETNPSDICILDWQLSTFGSPCLDISLFIWVCTDKEFRDQYYSDLIDLYYDTFSLFLRQLGGNPEKLFPRTVLQNHLKKFSLVGLLTSMVNVALNISEFSEVPYVVNEINNSTMLEIFAKITNEFYFTRMYENVNDFVRYGYILSAD